jgi:hypothetical protein
MPQSLALFPEFRNQKVTGNRVSPEKKDRMKEANYFSTKRKAAFIYIIFGFNSFLLPNIYYY